MPSPIPPLPPVTIATRPERSKRSMSNPFTLGRSARADQRRSAVDDEGLPGDVARLRRQQEADGMADVPAEPLDAEHRSLPPGLAAGRAHLPGVHARSVDRSGRDAIDADAVAAVIDRH